MKNRRLSRSQTSRIQAGSSRPGDGSTNRRTGDDEIFEGTSPYPVGTTMLTGHGRRLPGWPTDLGMAGARTPAPLIAPLIRAPIGLALRKESTKPFLRFRFYPKP